MVERKLTVTNEVGLHARPASVFVETASCYQSEIQIISSNGPANAKSILGVLALGVTKGTEISIVADGPDEEEAITELCRLIEEDFLRE
jgi:phosphotransferase system HPr (HPr) family protein